MRTPLLAGALFVLSAACGSSSEPSASPAAADPGKIGPDAGDRPPEVNPEAGIPDSPVAPPPLAPGAVDPSFGTNGVVTGTLDHTPTVHFSRDGRTALFHKRTDGVARLTELLANGAVDKTQGASGLATFPIPNATNEQFSLLASARVESDGSVFLFGGLKTSGANYAPFVGRVKGGGLDSTFGNSGGLWTFSDQYALVAGLVVDRDGGGAIKGFYTDVGLAHLAGATPRDASSRVYHLTAAGTTDSAFGGGTGYFELPQRGTSAAPYADQVVLDSSGLPLVISIPDTSHEVRRLTRAGALDPTYGTGGIAPITWDGQAAFRVNAIALAKGGLLAVLYNDVSSRLVRLTANGGVADAFPGSPTRDVPDAYLEVVDELADGRLLLFRHDANGKTTLERWRADGKPDTAFGTAGKVDVTALIGSGAGVLAIGVTSTGATMLAAGKDTGITTDWSVRRLGP